ncbi:MAG TPA: Uma2 family endonuclease, partial [Planctomycetota bacterium]|nr:Uma2 family endonuclease [Planctomycetota bacterium]
VADRYALGQVFAGLNVRKPGSGKRNFRVPDVVFVSKARSSILSDVGCEGGPDVLFEVRSEDDESYLKKRFYAEQGVLEFFVIDSESKRVELFRPQQSDMIEAAPDRDGWFTSEPLGVQLRRIENGGKAKLEVRDARSTTWSVVI